MNLTAANPAALAAGRPKTQTHPARSAGPENVCYPREARARHINRIDQGTEPGRQVDSKH
jgi:hypothetical protein